MDAFYVYMYAILNPCHSMFLSFPVFIIKYYGFFLNCYSPLCFLCRDAERIFAQFFGGGMGGLGGLFGNGGLRNGGGGGGGMRFGGVGWMGGM